jgi:tetratricopeptide (TPR) repeat protein
MKGGTTMKDSYFSPIKNPMTIISLFVGLVEVVLSVSLFALSDNLKSVIVWFIVLFPTLNAIAFFIVLCLFPQNFYGPHDYHDDQSYLSSLHLGSNANGKPASDQSEGIINTDLNSQQSLTDNVETSSAEENTWFRNFFDGKYEKAIELLHEEISKSSSDREKIGLKSVLGHMKSKLDFQGGTAYLQELIHQFPTDFPPYYWLCRTYLINDMPEKALEFANKGLSLSQEKESLIGVKVECLIQQGRIDESVAWLEKSISEDPSQIKYYSELTEILIKRDLKLAEVWFRKALSVSPKNELILQAYARFLLDNNRNEEALYRYTILTDIAPKDPSYLTLLGNVYLQLGLNNKAFELYEKANNLAGEKQAWIIANIGNLYANRGFYSKAIIVLNKALSLTPNDEYSHGRLAYAIKGETEENNKGAELIKKGQQINLEQEQLTLATSLN